MDDISTTILHVRSKDGDNFPDGEDIRTNFELVLNTPIQCLENESLVLSVASAEIPFTFYSTNSNNNFLQYTETVGVVSTVFSYQIDEGNYNVWELFDEIIAQMNARTVVAATYSYTYTTITNKATISTSANQVVFNFNTGSESNNLATPNGRSIARQMGWNGDSDITLVPATAVVSNSRVDLVTIHSLYIRTNISLGNTITSETKTNSSILVKIPIDTNYLNMIYFNDENYGSAKNYLSDKSLQRFVFTLTDQNGRRIDLGDEVNWEFTLNFNIINSPPERVTPQRRRLLFNEEVSEDKFSDTASDKIDKGITTNTNVAEEYSKPVKTLEEIENEPRIVPVLEQNAKIDETLDKYQKIINSL